ncbi:triple tyrosine motif-containing protein [Sphingomonas sp. RB3P16]|uniref:sensor histidine kinase n=1 Tax=Parasphingomonas frigoris TaxID=3096163 RepID=UPI002FC92660
MTGVDGLYRFDGISFEKMPALSDPELGEFEPLIVHASPNGDVWIGYRPGAVALYRKGRLYDLHMPNPPEFVTAITEDRRGGMWVVSGRSTQALSLYKAGKWQEVGEEQGVRGQIFHLFVDRQGITWIAQEGRISYRPLGSQRFIPTPAIVAPGRYRIGQGPDGRRWLSDQLGLRPLPDYPGGATDPARPLGGASTGRSPRFSFDQSGNFWGLSALRGIFKVSATQLNDPSARSHLASYEAADGLTSDSTVAILVDREDNVWVGTNGGLDKMRKAVVRTQGGLGPLSSGYGGETDAGGTTFIEDDIGIHAIGPDGKVKQISKLSGEITPPCRRFDGSVITMIPGTLLRLGPNRVTPFGLAPKGELGGCAGDARGRLWTYSNSLSWRDDVGWHDKTVPGPPLTPGGISSTPWGVAILRLGGTGLMLLDPQKLTMLKASAFRVGTIYSVNSGTRDLLISGSRGLARVRGNALRTIDASRFPWLTKLRALAQTRSGDTWMQSPAGIVRVRTSDLDHAFEDSAAQLPYDLIDAAEGLVGKGQKNGIWGQQILEGGDGVIRFLTSDGVVVIDPKEIKRSNTPPPVVISSLTSGATKYFDPVAIDLPAGRANITIDYSAPGVSVAERVRFRYKLEGYDDNWVDPGRRREAVYGNLAPGQYRFTVIAANTDGVWSRKGATLLITVAPAFYQTGWFKALCLLLGLILLWWAYRVRVQQLTARMQTTMGVRLAERERIARELHDTLLQTFQGLVLQFQAAANRMTPGDTARAVLERALSSADGALVEGRNRVRELRIDNPDEDFTEGWVALADKLGASRATRFKLTVEGRPRALHALAQDELQRLGDEALRNAFEHAHASVIEIIVSYRANLIRLGIRDNGVGLSREVASQGKRPGHYGLVGMRERARRIGGTFSVVSREGDGTEVLVSVPAKTAYSRPRRRWALAFWR